MPNAPKVVEPWVPRGGLLLHIGPHKTGTTAVQSAFAEARPRLETFGVSYPGQHAAPHGAAMARLGLNRGWNDAIAPGPRSMWSRFCALTTAAPGTVVVSSEQLCHATRRQTTALCDELRPGPRRVVITVRPLVEIIPSAWQEYVKSGWTVTYADFLASVIDDRPGADGPTPTFWKRHDHGRLVRRWATEIGPQDVAVVMSDRRSPRQVVDVFEDMLALPRQTLVPGAGPSNRSLRAAEVELVRQVNALAHGSVPWEVFDALVRQGGIVSLVEDRRPGEGEEPIGLPRWAATAAADFGSEAVRTIKRQGVEIVGRLAALASAGDAADSSSDAPVFVAPDAVHAYAHGVDRAVRRVLAAAPDRSIDDGMFMLQLRRLEALRSEVAIVDAAHLLHDLLLVAAPAVTT